MRHLEHPERCRRFCFMALLSFLRWQQEPIQHEGISPRFLPPCSASGKGTHPPDASSVLLSLCHRS